MAFVLFRATLESEITPLARCTIQISPVSSDSDFLYIKDPIVRQAIYHSMDMTPPANLEELRMLPDVMNLREKMLKQLATDVISAMQATTTPQQGDQPASASAAATIVRRQLPDAGASSHLITDEQLESAVKQAIEDRPPLPSVLATTAAAAHATDGYQALRNIDRSQMQCWRLKDPKYALIDLAVYGSAVADNVRRAAEELAICEIVPTIALALTFESGEQQLKHQTQLAQSRESRTQPTFRPQSQPQQHQLQHQPQQQLHRQHRNPSIVDYNRYNNRRYGSSSHSMLQPQQVITTNVIQVVNNVMPTVWLMSNPPTASASDWNSSYNPGFPPLHSSMPLGLRQQQQQQHLNQQQQQALQLDYYQSTVTTAAYGSMVMGSANTAVDGADVDATASDLSQRH